MIPALDVLEHHLIRECGVLDVLIFQDGKTQATQRKGARNVMLLLKLHTFMFLSHFLILKNPLI